VVIESPISIGSIVDFDPDIIRINIRMGEIVGRFTRVGFLDAMDAPLQAGRFVNPTQDPAVSSEDLEQRKKAEIIDFLDGEVARWRELEEARGNNWLRAYELRRKLEGRLEQYRDSDIVPPRRSISETLPLP
jgi:hypothetical protein